MTIMMYNHLVYVIYIYIYIGFAHSEVSRSSFGQGTPSLDLLYEAGASLTEHDLRPLFALDFNDPTKAGSTESLLEIGGIGEKYRDKMIWSPPKVFHFFYFFLFMFYLCYISLFVSRYLYRFV